MVAINTVHIVNQMRLFEQPELTLKSLPVDEEIMMIKEIGDQGTSCQWPLDPSHPHLTPYSPLPTHLVLRICDRPRRQKLLHHRRMPVHRSHMQRRVSILMRSAALRQVTPLAAQVRAPNPPTRDSLYLQTSKGKEKEVEQDNSLPAKTTMPRKAGLGLAHFRRDGNSVGEFLSIPESNQDKQEGA